MVLCLVLVRDDVFWAGMAFCFGLIVRVGWVF